MCVEIKIKKKKKKKKEECFPTNVAFAREHPIVDELTFGCLHILIAQTRTKRRSRFRAVQ
jgi:hypothetical protein